MHKHWIAATKAEGPYAIPDQSARAVPGCPRSTLNGHGSAEDARRDHFLQDAAGQPIRVLATAAHVSHDSSSSKMGDTSLDVYVGTDPRPPDGEALLEEFNSAPVFSSYVPHTDISRAVKQVCSCPRPS